MGDLHLLPRPNSKYREHFEQDVSTFLRDGDEERDLSGLTGYAIIAIIDDVPVVTYSAKSALQLLGAFAHAQQMLLDPGEEEEEEDDAC